MGDYIERKRVINLITSRYENPEICAQEINEIPAADVAPVVHARWEPEDNIFDDSAWYCSACHEPWTLIDGTPEDNNMHFCPNCGAKMDKEGSNQ